MRDTDTEFYKAWSAKHREAWDDLRKYVDIGEFLFSPASINILTKLMLESSEHWDAYIEHLQILDRAVAKCLPAIKAAARIDLKLPSR